MESGDVIQYLFPYRKKSQEGAAGEDENVPDRPCSRMPADKNAVYSCLDCVGKTVEEIMAVSGLPMDQVRTQLLDLLLEGQIVETVKGYYSIEL